MTPLPQNNTPVPTGLANWLDRNIARPMFLLSLAYLAVASGVIHRLGHGYFTLFEVHLVAWCLVAFWPIFAVEAGVRFFLTRKQMGFWPRSWILLGVLVFPPVRMGLRGYADPRQVWLPWAGWRGVDRALRRQMERFFSVPMIVIALMVLPVLALEFFWEETVRQHFWLAFGLDIASSVIWMAFAIEFILKASVAEKKIIYCVQNWMDMAVVVLPLIDFLPILRVWRLGGLLRLNQINRMGRIYRLRGLLMKAWRAILLLEMINRLLGNYKERRLKKLRDLVTAKEIELEELRLEMAELEMELREKIASADIAAASESAEESAPRETEKVAPARMEAGG